MRRVYLRVALRISTRPRTTALGSRSLDRHQPHVRSCGQPGTCLGQTGCQIVLLRAEHGNMGHPPLRLRRATERDHDVIVGLIDKTAAWLRTKNTDQWAQPWPSEEDRSIRIRRDLRLGKTWVASAGGALIATITADSEDSPVWPKETRHEPAVYVCRLVVSRTHAGEGLGSAFLDWAGLRGRQRYGARWIRVDVWTTNHALHAYYRRQGFEFWGLSEEVPDYPSAALFQKPTERIHPPGHSLFQLTPWTGG